jgi:hypothetical protein
MYAPTLYPESIIASDKAVIDRRDFSYDLFSPYLESIERSLLDNGYCQENISSDIRIYTRECERGD